MRTQNNARNDDLECSGEQTPCMPPTMAEVLMRIEDNCQDQIQLLKALVWNTAPHGGGAANHHDDYSEFIRTYPPIFTHAEDPIDTDDWLHTIKEKLALIR